MFFATYKTTIKTLLRAALFWMAAVLVLGIVIESALSIRARISVVENNRIVGHITDKDLEYREYMTYDLYVQTVQNSQSARLMIYTIPAFTVISTMLVLSRDHKDNFFEIEKAVGVKTRNYFFGRVTALLTVNAIVCLFCGLTGLHTYYFTRGGPPDCFSSVIEYLADSTIRVLRIFFCTGILTILFIMGITYMVGSLLHSGFAGGVVGFVNVLFIYASTSFLKFRMPMILLDYFTPYSSNLYSYWGSYDSKNFYHPLANPFGITDVLICTSYLLGMSLVFFIVSFICNKRRSI